MDAAEHPLCIFFYAGGARYALRAVSVLEIVAVAPKTQAAVESEDFVALTWLLCGRDESEPGVALVLDRGPTRGLRVGRVDGVSPVGEAESLPLGPRLAALLGPLVRGALTCGGRLAFELDAEAVATEIVRRASALGSAGQPWPSCARPAALESWTRIAAQGALVFQSGGRRMGVELPLARHVVPVDPSWNPIPFGGACLGALVHRERLVPVYGVPPVAKPEGFVVIVEVRGELLGLAASLPEGVRPADALASVEVLDLLHMFS